jgi:hypothetical protein
MKSNDDDKEHPTIEMGYSSAARIRGGARYRFTPACESRGIQSVRPDGHPVVLETYGIHLPLE